ncbi:hypothetical protein SDC9_186043 [bioreactor metagenome]|uniref:Uncharacterized protein n=1 Tax=bioreactor metagenome TaxID=1076179 RepID=A0A645HJZ7_9ZZZZ
MGCVLARSPGAQLRPEGKHGGGGQQQPGHDLAEGGIGREQQQRRTGGAADQGQSHHLLHGQARRGLHIVLEAPGAGHIARQQGHGSRGIGNHGRHAGEDQRGKGQKAAATGDRVERAGRESCGQQKGEVAQVLHVLVS